MEGTKEEIQRVKRLFAKKSDPLRPVILRKKIKRIMEEKVGLSRNDQGLREAIDCFRDMKRKDLPRLQVPNIGIFNYELQDAIEVGFMVQVAHLVAKAPSYVPRVGATILDLINPRKMMLG